MAITYAAGTNLITLDDEVGAGDSWANAYDMDDVLAADVAGAWGVVTKQGANAFDVSARMYFAAGVYFVSKSEFVELKPNPTNPVYVAQAHSGSHIRIGEYNATYKYSYNGAFWRIYVNAQTGDNTTGNRFSGELLIYGSNIESDTTNYQKGLHIVAGSTFRLYNSIWKSPSYQWAANSDHQDVKVVGNGASYDMLYAVGFDYNFAGITASGCKYGAFFSATTSSACDLYNVTFQNSITSDIYLSPSCNYLIRLVNSPTFSTCSAIGAGKPGLKICYTFNVKVINSNNSPIVGATVEVKDTDGTVVFSEDTIAGGVLTANKIIPTYWYRNAAEGGNKNYNDFTLKVRKAGTNYLTYETDFTLAEERDWTITMVDMSDLITDLDDIKGTGFVKDTHSLVDLEAYVDGIESKTNNLPTDPADQSLVEAKIDTTITEINANETKIDTAITNIATLDGKIVVVDNEIAIIDTEIGVINGKVDTIDTVADEINATTKKRRGTLP